MRNLKHTRRSSIKAINVCPLFRRNYSRLVFKEEITLIHHVDGLEVRTEKTKFGYLHDLATLMFRCICLVVVVRNGIKVRVSD